jgi:hypothetical protein
VSGSTTSVNEPASCAGIALADAAVQPRSVPTYALIFGCVLLAVEAGLVVRRIRIAGNQAKPSLM